MSTESVHFLLSVTFHSQEQFCHDFMMADNCFHSRRRELSSQSCPRSPCWDRACPQQTCKETTKEESRSQKDGEEEPAEQEEEKPTDSRGEKSWDSFDSLLLKWENTVASFAADLQSWQGKEPQDGCEMFCEVLFAKSSLPQARQGGRPKGCATGAPIRLWILELIVL